MKTNYVVKKSYLHGWHLEWDNGREHFPVREMSENFEQTEKSGNFTQNTGKIGNFYTGKLKRNTRKVRKICQPEKAKHGNALNRNKLLKILENGKNTGQVMEICQSEKVGTMIYDVDIYAIHFLLHITYLCIIGDCTVIYVIFQPKLE